MSGEIGGHKREYFRLKLDPPLCANMTIVLIKGKTMEIGSTSVLIEDLAGGGLRFLSHLKMPANDQLVLQFETLIGEEKIKMYGHIVRTNSWEESFYEYAVRFTMEEAQHTEINRLVNRLAIRLRNRKGINDDRYFKGDRCQFLREQADLAKKTSQS